MRPEPTTLRKITIFAAGLALGYGIQPVRAQREGPGIKLNHVGITVPNLDEGIKFYTRALGAKEAITFRDDRGRPFSYLQLSRETFLELQETPAGQAPGLLHIGLEVENLAGAIPQFKQGGLEVGNPSESARTKALISQATGPNGMKFELLEFGPDSVQRKVMNAWK